MGRDSDHSVTLVLRIGLDDAVCRGVVTGSIHGIRAGFVEGGLFSHVNDMYSRRTAR
jgi:hypothetical protein